MQTLRFGQRFWLTAVVGIGLLGALQGAALAVMKDRSAATVGASHTVGETSPFWVRDDIEGFVQIQAKLASISASSYVYIASGVSIPEGIAARTGREFDSVVYPGVRAAFGKEPAPGIDGDSRLTLLLTDHASTVAGYFDPRNQYSMAMSNAREMLVLNVHHLLAPGADLDKGFELLMTTAAHEFQHLVSYAADPREELWVTEGLSQYAEYLLYGDTSRLSYFEANPTISLTEWSWSLESYGASLAFVLYLAEHYSVAGDLSGLVAQEATGIAGIDAYLKDVRPGVTFADVFRDWTVANYVNDPALAGGRYGYTKGSVNLGPSATSSYLDAGSISLPPWSAAYVTLGAGESRVLELDLNMALGVDKPDISCTYRADSGEVRVEDIAGHRGPTGTWYANLPGTSSPVTLVVRSGGRAQPDLAYRIMQGQVDYERAAAIAVTVVGAAASLLRGTDG